MAYNQRKHGEPGVRMMMTQGTPWSYAGSGSFTMLGADGAEAENDMMGINDTRANTLTCLSLSVSLCLSVSLSLSLSVSLSHSYCIYSSLFLTLLYVELAASSVASSVDPH